MLPLRTNCPQCKKRIPALRALLAQCPFCKLGDYHAPVASMPEESMLWRGELLLFRALGVPSPQINTPADMFTDAPLLGLCPMDYFHLYRSMTRTLSHLFWPEDILKLCLNLHVLTQEEMATHSMLYGASQAPEVVLFHALFSRWPHNFFLFLDIVYQAFILGDHFEEVLRGFHALFEEELRGEAFAWVLQAYRDHLEQFQREKRARAESEALSACTIPLPGSIRQSIERKREVLHTMQEGWSGFHEWLALRERCIRQAEEQEQAKRRRIQELLPLPRRVVPQPWENLASVITRAAQVMGYSQPGWILRPEKAGYSIPREALPPVVIKWVMKWSRYCGVGKLGLYSSTEGDEQYAKGTTNVYKRVQAGSHTFGEDKRQEY